MPTSAPNSTITSPSSPLQPTRELVPTTTHAKISRYFAHAGIAHSLRKGERDQPLDVEYRVNDLLFHFMSPKLCGADDWRILCALIALATAENSKSADKPQGAVDTEETDNVARLLKHTVSLKTNYTEIAREAGYAAESGSAYRVRNSLKRWFAASVFVEKLGISNSLDVEGHHILKELKARDQGGKVELTFCPVLSAAILGGSGEYLRLDMPEFRRLTSDVSRLLHIRLHWINQGKFSRVGLDTLVGYAYNDDLVEDYTIRRRRSAVREALEELRTNLNWHVEHADGMYLIGRPARSTKQAPATSSTSS
jgi:hypothetical protein